MNSKWALHTIPGPLIPPFPWKPCGGSSIQVALLLPSLSVALAYYQKPPSHTRQALLFRFVYLQILKIPLLLFQGPAPVITGPFCCVVTVNPGRRADISSESTLATRWPLWRPPDTSPATPPSRRRWAYPCRFARCPWWWWGRARGACQRWRSLAPWWPTSRWSSSPMWAALKTPKKNFGAKN